MFYYTLRLQIAGIFSDLRNDMSVSELLILTSVYMKFKEISSAIHKSKCDVSNSDNSS